MKHAISFYIDDDAEIIGFCGSVVTKTNDNKTISCFNLNENQLRTENTWHIEHNGKGTAIGKNRECALIIERKSIHGGPFRYEEWCTCGHCGYRQALFIPRNYCPKCGYKFTSIINKGDVETEDKNE